MPDPRGLGPKEFASCFEICWVRFEGAQLRAPAVSRKRPAEITAG